MWKVAIGDAGVKQDDIAKVFNVSQSVVSRLLKEYRKSGSIRKRKRFSLIFECKGVATEALWSVVNYPTTT